MGRIRTIKPEFFDDERVGSLDPLAQLVCAWAITDADDAGRLRWTPAHVRAGAWKYREVSLPETAEHMAAIEAARFVVSYEDDGQRYALIRTWFTHQVLDATKVRPNGQWVACPPPDVIALCHVYRNGAIDLLDRAPVSRFTALSALILPGYERGSRVWAPPVPTGGERGTHVGRTWGADRDQTGTRPDQTDPPPNPPAGGTHVGPTAGPRGTQTPEPEVLDVEVLEPEVVEDPAPKPKRTRAPKDPTPEPEIPAWVPRAEWDAFDTSRQRGKGKATWTPTARTMALRTLAELRASGEDPAAVLRASVVGGWSGLFPVKRGGSARPAPIQQRGGAELLLERLDAADAARGRLL